MKYYLIILTLVMAACIQGPWEYKPKNDPEYMGIYTEGTLVADRKIQDICFERLLSLDEYFTDAFAFYSQANITVTGAGSTESLSAQVERPNCFEGSDSFIIQRGESYTLNASITWDSAGSRVTSNYSAVANVPTRLIVNDTATVNDQAFTNPNTVSDLSSPEGLLELVQGLPDEGQTEFLNQYDIIINDFTALLNAGDTVAATELFIANASAMNETISELYQKYEVRAPYVQGDTIYYLTGGLNTTSHYYNFDYSEDVASILVTQSYDEDNIIPLNSFSAAFQQFGLDAAGQYFEGTTRRLIHYPYLVDNERGFSVFDSLPVTNTWYLGGNNTFYFYGYDNSMNSYIETYIREHDNPKVRPEFNIENGRGVFAGAVVDSFQVFIRNPTGNRSWTSFEAEAGFCELEGWTSSPSCQDFELRYCRETDFDPEAYVEANKELFDENRAYSKCLKASYKAAWIDDVSIETYTERNPNFDDLFPEEIEQLRIEALAEYCVIESFVPDRCSAIESELRQWQANYTLEQLEVGYDKFKQIHWDRCEDNRWSLPSCDWGLRSFCLEKDINSDVLCGPAEEWCQSNPDDIFCGKEPTP